MPELTATELLDPTAEPDVGPVAAVVAALAAAVAGVAAERSKPVWGEAAGARAQAQALRRRALELGTRDASSYAEARAALAARGGGGEGVDALLGEALRRAADAPIQIAIAAADIAELAAQIAVHGAPDVRADGAGAAILAAAAARAAVHLVEINLVVGGDRDVVEPARSRARDAQRAADAAAHEA